MYDRLRDFLSEMRRLSGTEAKTEKILKSNSEFYEVNSFARELELRIHPKAGYEMVKAHPEWFRNSDKYPKEYLRKNPEL